jgi:hypothetical protein
MDPNAVGKMTEFERAQFYDYMKRAQEAGVNVGAQQQSLADALLARSQGRGGPSLAELQLQQTLAQQKQDIAGNLAAAGRGINPALARRILIQQQAQAAQGTAGQAAILRAKEQLDAQNALAAQLGNMRAAEQAAYSTSATAGLSQEKLGVEAAEAQKTREMERAKANQQAALDLAKMKTASDTASKSAVGNLLGVLGSAFIPKAQGGLIQKYAEGGKVSKAKQIAVHAAAKKHMKSFKEQYGAEEGERIAYATMMKNRKKLAEGGVAEEEIDGFTSSQRQKLAETEQRMPLGYYPRLPKEIQAGNSETLSKVDISKYDVPVPAVLKKYYETNKSRNLQEIDPDIKAEYDRYRSHQEMLDRYHALIENAKIEMKDSDRSMKYDQELPDRMKAKIPPAKMPEVSSPGTSDKMEIAVKKKPIVTKMAEGGKCMAEGGEVNAAAGKLAKMDNEKNDTVPAMLSPGEIVIPRSVVAAPNPGEAAKKFVEALLANRDPKSAKMSALKAALGKK